MAWTVHCADNLELLRAMPDASVDSIVTDPPYEIDMMGRAWDGSGVAFEVERWRECLRVLKPGGYLIAFSSARTYHRLAVAIEDAGAAIRDQLIWIYGTGFPKSPRDITAAMDRAKDDRADVLTVTAWIKAARDAAGLTNAGIDDVFGLAGMAGHWTTQESQPAVPTAEQWPALLAMLGEPPAEVAAIAERIIRAKGQPDDAWFARPVVGEHAKPAASAMWRETYDGDNAAAGKIRSSATTRQEAEAWVGWATALRPSHEPAVMARKRFTGPTFRNVLEHGTGAINVGGCRLPARDTLPAGGWPPNVLLSPMAAADLDGHARAEVSLFFYCDKASTAEREAGLEDRELAEKWTDGRKVSADYPSLRGATDRRNVHPTVKPIDVMRWLVRLVTPPGGIVLDPYTGSGSTGIAAVLEGFEFVGAELDPLHVEIAQARIGAAEAGVFYSDPARQDRTAIRSPLARRQGALDL